MYKKTGNGIIIKLVFFATALIFSAISVYLAMELKVKIEDINLSHQEIARLEEEKNNLQKKLEALETDNNKSKKELENLEKEINDIKRSNPQWENILNAKGDKIAYLTFDDGPSKNTVKILDFLKLNNIKATFFVIYYENSDDIYKRIVDEGHTLAIHSMTHNYSAIYRNTNTFMQDIEKLSNHLFSVTGVKPNVFRFPGGSNNRISIRYGGHNLMNQIIPKVEEAGYTYFDWNVDSRDADKNVQDKEVIVQSVLEGAKDKTSAIILMHDAAPKTTTVEALPEVIEGLRAQGFLFEQLTPNSPLVQFQ